MDTILANCKIVDVESEAIAPETAVRIGDGVITALLKSEDIGDESEHLDVQDLEGMYLVPGLMNLHTHLGLTHHPSPPDRSPAARVLRMAVNARDSLRVGVTTIRLVGEHDHTDFDLRQAIWDGQTTGPDIFTAGQALCCSGGHGSGIHGGALELDGAAEFARGVRHQVSMGADVIKVCITGGIAGAHEGINDSQLSDAELESVIGVAHGWGKKVTAHASSPAAIEQGVGLGLDGVEHGYSMNESTASLMAKHGTWLVPTLSVTRARTFYERLQRPPATISKALDAGETHMAGIQAAVSSGIRIALGTDMLPHEEFDETSATVRELEFLVDAGLSPAGALKAATVSAAAYLDIAHQVGQIAVGYKANLIAVASNPLQSISNMRELRGVWKGGTAVQSIESHGIRTV